MMRKSNDQHGISPMIGIIIIVAITLIVAGVSAVWFFGFQDYASEDRRNWFFVADLDGGDDSISVTLMNGEPFNTSIMTIKVDAVDIMVSPQNMSTGDKLEFPTGMDIIPGNSYEVKIIMNNHQMYIGNPTANP